MIRILLLALACASAALLFWHVGHATSSTDDMRIEPIPGPPDTGLTRMNQYLIHFRSHSYAVNIGSIQLPGEDAPTIYLNILDLSSPVSSHGSVPLKGYADPNERGYPSMDAALEAAKQLIREGKTSSDPTNHH